MDNLHNKRIILGITASIALIKIDNLIDLLKGMGAEIKIVITKNALKLVEQLIAEKRLSKRPDFFNGSIKIYTNMFEPITTKDIEHISLAHWANLILIAPATANIMAKIANGIADDLLSTVCLATRASIAFAPAMNDGMWLNTATQKNVKILNSRGAKVFGPGIGQLACGDIGPGRMLEPELLAEMVANIFLPPLLKGQKVVITAGKTEEPIDPVRIINNHSSGKMGYAIAEAAKDFAANVTLISGPTNLQPPAHINLIKVKTAEEMFNAVMTNINDCNIFIAAAAVADYRPKIIAKQKIKKTTADELTINLSKNPDILASVAILKKPPFTVGFAAETENIEQNANDKLKKKNIDIIAANYVGENIGFNSEQNQLIVFTRKGEVYNLTLKEKKLLAVDLLQIIARNAHNC